MNCQTNIKIFFYSVHQDKTTKVKVKKETPNAAAIYKFEAKRKRWEGSNHAEKEITNFANEILVK